MKIAIVHRMPAVVAALGDAITFGAHRLAWVATDGAEAVRRCAENQPDLVLLDLSMAGGLDAIEITRRIMADSPCAILLIAENAAAHTAAVFGAMGAGALDVVDPPTTGGAAAVVAKIVTISRLIGKNTSPKPRAHDPARPASDAASAPSVMPASPREPLVAIGSSAGGPAALAAILTELPADFGAGIVIVQHVDEKFAPELATWLGEHTPLSVRLARAGDCPAPGTVLVAGRGDHLHFTTARTLGYTPHPVDYAYRPSVDVFFESAARWWRGDILGILLTGMGRDGAAGLKILRDRGYHTIAQDQASSAIYGMPQHAARIGAAREILPLLSIGGAVKKFAPKALTGSVNSGEAIRVSSTR